MTLSFLGRSFSVMPEARCLVTAGPYAFVRHPLYLFELLGVIGILLQVRSMSVVALLSGFARPLPDDALKIVMRGVDKEDKAAA